MSRSLAILIDLGSVVLLFIVFWKKIKEIRMNDILMFLLGVGFNKDRLMKNNKLMINKKK